MSRWTVHALQKAKQPHAWARGRFQSGSQALRPTDGPLCSENHGVVKPDAERILVDRFGHRREVLKLLPEEVREVMGLRFVDRTEPGAANAGVP